MDIPEGRIRADRLDIEFNQVPLISKQPQRVKLYYIATLPQKIQLWLILGLLLGSLITNLTSIASSFHLLPESNTSSQYSPRFWVKSISTLLTLDPWAVLSGFCGAPGSSMSQVSREKRSRNIYGASRPIRCTSRRAVGSPTTTPMWRGSMLSGRPTWPICKISPGRTVEWGTFSR